MWLVPRVPQKSLLPFPKASHEQEGQQNQEGRDLQRVRILGSCLCHADTTGTSWGVRCYPNRQTIETFCPFLRKASLVIPRGAEVWKVSAVMESYTSLSQHPAQPSQHIMSVIV